MDYEDYSRIGILSKVKSGLHSDFTIPEVNKVDQDPLEADESSAVSLKISN